MRIRTAVLAATIAALPVFALAQTAAPVTSPPPASSSATPDKPHRDHGGHHKRRAEMHAKYENLSAADKAKFDALTKQMKQLHEQRMQILGVSKS
jgi:Spy/CpxP family protein refolding chaperone